MFSRHVTKKLSTYCNEELTADESRYVGEHLISCNRCRADYDLIKLGVRLAERLPRVAAPGSLWPQIESGSISVGSQKEKKRASTFNWLLPRAAAVTAALAIVAVVTFVVFYRAEARPFWEVARLAGAPLIGSNKIGDKGRLTRGQWLETDARSRAQINVGHIGQVEIDPNTRVRLVETKSTEHRLELARGRLSAHIWAPPKLFFVDTPSAVAADLGCAYTLEVDDHGGSLLRVTSGWVALQLRNRESMVPSGAACATRQGIGPGTPYFEDASPNFRAALAQVDFGNSGPDRTASLRTLLAESRVRDTLTLWHLLSRVDGDDRVYVYTRMMELVPAPEGVTRDGVLSLNQDMLNSWRDKLQANWSDYSSPTMKALKKVWTTGLGKLNGLEGKK